MRITVCLDGERLARLDERARELGVSRSEALRQRLDASEPGESSEIATPTRLSTLLKLEKAAAAGSVTAMATLARELRLGGEVRLAATRRRGRKADARDAGEPTSTQVDELERLRALHKKVEAQR